jgi:hypothetical protein
MHAHLSLSPRALALSDWQNGRTLSVPHSVSMRHYYINDLYYFLFILESTQPGFNWFKQCSINIWYHSALYQILQHFRLYLIIHRLAPLFVTILQKAFEQHILVLRKESEYWPSYIRSCHNLNRSKCLQLTSLFWNQTMRDGRSIWSKWDPTWLC